MLFIIKPKYNNLAYLISWLYQLLKILFVSFYSHSFTHTFSWLFLVVPVSVEQIDFTCIYAGVNISYFQIFSHP